ncbi:MAG: hypothetical protein HQL31_06570 [Planctomycetes bacterium]|nr:hypothetical protein [Planctomycetota bacterium]
MGRFWFRLLIFGLGLCLLDIAVLGLILCGSHLFRTELYSTARDYPESEILILGSSHAREGISPQFLLAETGLSAYNLGGAGQNSLVNNYLSRLLVARGRRPAIVMISVGYDDLHEYSRPHILTQFVPPEELGGITWHFIGQKNWNSLRNFFYADRYSSSARMALSRALSWAVTGRRQPRVGADPARGYHPFNRSVQPLARPASPGTAPFICNPLVLAALKEMAALWRAKGAQVLILDTPEYLPSRLYRGEYSRYQALMEEVAGTSGAHFRSFNDPEIEWLNDPGCFRDGGWERPNSHLNIKGGMRFNKLLSEWMRELGLVEGFPATPETR